MSSEAVEHAGHQALLFNVLEMLQCCKVRCAIHLAVITLLRRMCW